jgi:hypothetical protein
MQHGSMRCPRRYATALPVRRCRPSLMQAIVDLDLDELASIEPPRGFGRD